MITTNKKFNWQKNKCRFLNFMWIMAAKPTLSTWLKMKVLMWWITNLPLFSTIIKFGAWCVNRLYRWHWEPDRMDDVDSWIKWVILEARVDAGGYRSNWKLNNVKDELDLTGSWMWWLMLEAGSNRWYCNLKGTRIEYKCHRRIFSPLNEKANSSWYFYQGSIVFSSWKLSIQYQKTIQET